MTSFYLSFADETKFLGAAVVDADNFLSAMTKINIVGINPGGEVLCFEMPKECDEQSMERNRLYSKEELRARGMKSLKEYDDSEYVQR